MGPGDRKTWRRKLPVLGSQPLSQKSRCDLQNLGILTKYRGLMNA